MRDTLYSLEFPSGSARNGVNHSTYAKCSGGQGSLSRKKCCHDVLLMLKTTRIWATWYAVVQKQSAMITIYKSHWHVPCIDLFMVWESPTLISATSKRPGTS